jgi:hypothetical protein
MIRTTNEASNRKNKMSSATAVGIQVAWEHSRITTPRVDLLSMGCNFFLKCRQIRDDHVAAFDLNDPL